MEREGLRAEPEVMERAGTERTPAMGGGTAFAVGAPQGTHPPPPCLLRREKGTSHFVPHQLFTRPILPAAGHSTGTGTATVTAGNGDAAAGTP